MPDDTKFDDGTSGTITDSNYTDPYSGNDEDPVYPTDDTTSTISEDDLRNEGKGEPDGGTYIPIDERNAPFAEEEAEIIAEAKKKKMLLTLSAIGLLAWLS